MIIVVTYLYLCMYIVGKYNIDYTYLQIHFVETYEEGKQNFNFGGYQENVKRETIWKNDADNNGIVLCYIFSNLSTKKGKNIYNTFSFYLLSYKYYWRYVR